MATASTARNLSAAVLQWLARLAAFIPMVLTFVAVWGALSLTFNWIGVLVGWLPALWLAGVVGYLWPLAWLAFAFIWLGA